jgi:hypothetical protein
MGEERKIPELPVHEGTPRHSGAFEEDSKLQIIQVDNIHGHTVDIPWPLDPVKEKKVMRKVDLVLVPWLFLLFLLAFLDRVNSKPCRLEEDILTDSSRQRKDSRLDGRFGVGRRSIQHRSPGLLCPLHPLRGPFEYLHQEAQTFELAFLDYVHLGDCHNLPGFDS